MKAIAAAAVAVAVLAAACGAEKRLSRKEYGAHLRHVVSVFEGACFVPRPRAGATRADVARQTLAAIRRCRGALARDARELRSLRPPKDVEHANGELAAGFLEVRAGFGRVDAALRSGDLPAASDALVRAFRGARRFAAAQRELVRHGYTFELLGLP